MSEPVFEGTAIGDEAWNKHFGVDVVAEMVDLYGDSKRLRDEVTRLRALKVVADKLISDLYGALYLAGDQPPAPFGYQAHTMRIEAYLNPPTKETSNE